MYYASPSDQGGWWGAGRWGVSMSDAPWHWLYKWLHLHAFHFPAHRSRDELIGPSLIGDDWLQLGLPAHPDGLHVWQRLLTQWLNCAPPTPTPTHIPVSPGPNCQRHKGGQRLSVPGHRCDHESLLALAEECTVQEEKGAKLPPTITCGNCFDLWLLSELWRWHVADWKETFPSGCWKNLHAM